MPRRSWASAACGGALLAVLAVGGCGTAEDGGGGDPTLRVYVSLPLSGDAAAEGRHAADGAELALADAGGEAAGVAVEAVVLDDAEDGRWSAVAAAANARKAASDSTAIAYLGELESGATRVSLPITGEARMLQVSPGSTAEDLIAPFVGSDELPEVQSEAGRSFGRVIPGDAVQGEAAAVWAQELGWRRIAIESDGGRFAKVLASSFEDRAQELGLELAAGSATHTYVAGQGTTDDGSIISDGVLPPYAEQGINTAGRATSAALDPSQLPPQGRDFTQSFQSEYDRAPGRYAAYGYEAMAVILDSIERASEPTDRAAVISAFFETPERETVLGRYAIDELGQTTLERLGGYELGDGPPRPAEVLDAGG